jgi:multiple sugar transport system substrate-binding protein
MLHGRKRHPLNLLFVLLVVFALGLSACGPTTPAATTAATQPAATQAAPATDAPATQAAPATEAPPEATAAPEPVELHMTWWGSQTRHDQTIQVIELFQQEYPWITISYEFASFGDYWPLLSTKAAAGELPDILQQDYAYFKQYVTDGLLIPLDPYVQDGTINLDAVSPDVISGGQIDGQLYALSLGTNSQSWVLDADLFEQAGVPIPEPDWTWQDFEDVNLQIHESLGIWGNGGDLANPQIVNCMFLSLGQGLYSDDGASLGFADDQPLIDYLGMMKRLQDAGAMISREEQVASPPTLENNALVTQQAAMYFAHTNQLLALWGAAGEERNLMMLPVPRATGATQSANYFKPSMFFSVSAHSEHPQEAAMFIDFFTNSVEANEIMLAERGIPISSAVQEAIAPSLPPAQVEAANFLKSLEGNVSPIRPPDPAKHNELMTNVWAPQIIDALMFGQVTPEEAVALFRNEATTLLTAQ